MNDVLNFTLIVAGAAIVVIIIGRILLKNSFLLKIGYMIIAICWVMVNLGFIIGTFGLLQLIWAVPIGILLIAILFKILISEVRNPVYTITSTLRQLSLGNLHISLPEKLVGRKDEIGEALYTLDQYVSITKKVSDFASEIGKGNLNTNYNLLSEEDQLGRSLVNMRDQLKAVINETDHIITQAGEKGELNARLDDSDKEGAWKDLYVSINVLLTSFARPLLSLTQIVESLEKGDLTERYEGHAEGNVAKLTNSLNMALESLNGLIKSIVEMVDTVGESATEISVNANDLNIAISEIASSTGQMSNGAQSQLSKIDESSSLLEQILKSSKEMEIKSRTINETAIKNVDESVKGSKMINYVEESIEEISKFSKQTRESMQVMEQNSNEISKILNVISDISAQTNLLSLNAAIEAAQAGEAGRGFAVVAEEIRKLAEDSKASAKEIEKLVTNVNSNTTNTLDLTDAMVSIVEKSVEASKSASQVFNDMTKSSQITLSESERILESTALQDKNISNVVSLIEGVVVVSEQTATGAEEVATSASEFSSGMQNFKLKSESLDSIATKLKSELSNFKL